MFEKIPELKNEESISPEKIEIIESMQLSPNEKVELILIASGDKLATEIELVSDTWEIEKKELPKKISENKLEKIKKALDSLGFFYKVHNPEIDEIITIEDESIPKEDIRPENEIRKEREKIKITISKNEEARKKLEEAADSMDDKKMGELYGFPKTSTEEYQKGEKANLIGRKDLPEDIKKEEWTLFATFMFSKKNWKKELGVVKKWAETVEKNSPKIYNEYVKLAREMDNFN